MLGLNKKQIDALEGLYFWSRIAPEAEKEDAQGLKKTFRLLARDLDKLGVSWRIQNYIAYAAGLEKNRDRYFVDVLKDFEGRA